MLLGVGDRHVEMAAHLLGHLERIRRIFSAVVSPYLARARGDTTTEEPAPRPMSCSAIGMGDPSNPHVR